MTKARVGRNDPCPCGSGKKYKHCHGRGGATRPVILPPWGMIGIVVVVVGAVALLWNTMRKPGTDASRAPLVSRGATAPPAGANAPPGALEPRDWQYDPRQNQYWDPVHRHWHNGAPPLDTAAFADSERHVSSPGASPETTAGPAARPTAPPTPTTPVVVKPEPAPYFYDAATNRHWDPNHHHWHDGMPPPESLRSAARAGQPGAAPPVTPVPASSETARAASPVDTTKK